MKKTRITVEGDDANDSLAMTAALNIFFRRLGAAPVLVTERHEQLMRLAFDEWTANNTLQGRFNAEDGLLVEIVDQPEKKVVPPAPARSGKPVPLLGDDDETPK